MYTFYTINKSDISHESHVCLGNCGTLFKGVPVLFEGPDETSKWIPENRIKFYGLMD